MNILSLCDGFSCSRMALNRIGVKYDHYFSSEIDKYAMKVSQEIYPDTIQLGDITKWKKWDLPKIDLIIGGTPCQGFSFAGLGFEFVDERSKLIFDFFDILKFYNPKYFLLENVRMKNWQEEYISEKLGKIRNKTIGRINLFGHKISPRIINSALVSAQNRLRLYWTDIAVNGQPDDKGIVLKDILESGIVDRDKSYCLDANYQKTSNSNANRYFNKSSRQIVFETPVVGAFRGRYLIDGKRQDYKMKTAGLTEQRLEFRKDEKSNTLTTVEKDNIVVEFFPNNKTERSKNKIKNNLKMGHEKSNVLTTDPRPETTIGTAIQDRNLVWRKLTVRECARLQTIPEEIIDIMLSCGVSNNQLYKMIGNGFTIDVVAYLLKRL